MYLSIAVLDGAYMASVVPDDGASRCPGEIFQGRTERACVGGIIERRTVRYQGNACMQDGIAAVRSVAGERRARNSWKCFPYRSLAPCSWFTAIQVCDYA